MEVGRYDRRIECGRSGYGGLQRPWQMMHQSHYPLSAIHYPSILRRLYAEAVGHLGPSGGSLGRHLIVESTSVESND